MDTATNLSEYRMNSYAEIEAYFLHPGSDNFKVYLNKVYVALESMNPMDKINILKDVAPANREKFVKICCLFISEGNTDYVFSEDYTVIKKLPEKPEKSIAEFKANLNLKRKRNELDKTETTNNNTP